MEKLLAQIVFLLLHYIHLSHKCTLGKAKETVPTVAELGYWAKGEGLKGRSGGGEGTQEWGNKHAFVPASKYQGDSIFHKSSGGKGTHACTHVSYSLRHRVAFINTGPDCCWYKTKPLLSTWWILNASCQNHHRHLTLSNSASAHVMHFCL